MELYLVRHGEAYPEGADAQRSLTERGRRQVKTVAEFARSRGIRPVQIRHSGKLRAEQTAGILAESLGLEDEVVAVGGMGPNDDVRNVADILEAGDGPVMLVGHLPFLSRLASLLLCGDPDREIVGMGTAAMLGLIRTAESWRIQWMVTPALADSDAIP